MNLLFLHVTLKALYVYCVILDSYGNYNYVFKPIMSFNEF